MTTHANIQQNADAHVLASMMKSAPVATPPNPATAPNPNTPPPSSPWGQVSGGPAAYAYPAILKLMSVLMQLQGLYNNQANYQVDTQIACANASAQDTIAAANAQAAATALQATSSFVSAGMSLYTSFQTNKETDPLMNEIAEKQTQSNELTAMEKPLATRMQSSQDTTFTEVQRNVDPVVAHQRDLLVNGNFDEAREYAAKQPRTDNITEKAIALMNGRNEEGYDELATFSDKLQTKQKILADNMSVLSSKQQRIQNNYSMWKDIVTGVANGFIQGGEAAAQGVQGQKQASATVFNTDSQLAGSMLATSEQLLGKWYDEALQALGTLQSLAQSAKVN